MRLRKNQLKTLYLKKRRIDQDDEGNDIVSFDDTYSALDMTVQPAGGKIMASIYGEKLPYVKSCQYQGDELQPNQNEGDGICLYADKLTDPDYEIVSIIPHTFHHNVTLKKRDGYEIKN